MSSLVVHFEIHASEPQRLIDFYSALLGWRFEQYAGAPYWTIDTGSGSIREDAPGMGINGGLAQREGPPPAAGAPINGTTVVIGVRDTDEVVARALELGASEAVPVSEMEDIGRLAYLRDPDGNVFGVISDRLADGRSVRRERPVDLEAPMHGESVALDPMNATPEP